MNEFSLEHFDEFLTIAKQQPKPQTLLLVLAERELPHGHTAEQERQYREGNGGHLAPLGSIGKQANQLDSFAELSNEASQVVERWDAVFVAAMDQLEETTSSASETDKLLEKMVNDIRTGLVSKFLTFDKQGSPLTLEHA